MLELTNELIALFKLAFSNPLQLIEDGQVYIVLFPTYVLLLGGERLAHFLMRNERRWNNLDSATNLTMTFLTLLIDATLSAIIPLAILAFLYENFRLFTIPYVWWGWVVVFLLWDLAWYIDHRIAHRVGVMWSLHHVHHSSREFNMTVASRGFLLEVMQRPAWFLLPIFGMSPLMFITIKVATSVWGIAQHTRLVPKLPVLDKLFATPSNHRVHHGSNPDYIDKNYGEILMIWDHLFGTYQAEKEEVTFGLTKNIRTYNPVKIQMAGIKPLIEKIKSAPKLSDKIKYLFKPPGWEHDSNTITKEQLNFGTQS